MDVSGWVGGWVYIYMYMRIDTNGGSVDCSAFFK